MSERIGKFVVTYVVQIDADADPVGSAIIWIRGRIQWNKMKGKAEFNLQTFFFLVENYIFQV